MLLLLLVAANLATMVGVFTLGRFHTDPATLLDYLGSRLLGSEWTGNPEVAHVIWNIRFPRMVAALLVGGALSVAGAAYQSLFRNPLVSPDVLGASSGAGFGAALAIVLGLGPTGLQGVAFLFGLLRWQLDAVTFGEETAKSLGTNVTWLRAGVIVCATILTAVSVSISGVIGWVGLIVPHVTRILFGPQHRLLIPVSFLLGSLFLIGVDTISRTLLDAEIPLGILTALLGAPFLAWLMMGNRSW